MVEEVDEETLDELKAFLEKSDNQDAAIEVPSSMQSMPPGIVMGQPYEVSSAAAASTGGEDLASLLADDRGLSAKRGLAAPTGGASGGTAAWPSWKQASGGGLTGEGAGHQEPKIELRLADPTAKILAATDWSALSLSKEILDAIYAMGYVKPSKIQEWALPIAMGGGNIIGQAQNGSGKTAAFSLSMLHAIDASGWYPQAICISHTRELATQNCEVLRQLGQFTGAGFFLAVPQEGRPPRKVQDQIIVGTPGKLQELLQKRIIEGKWIKLLVIDEADEMLDESNSMGTQVMGVKSHLPEELQVLLFSATWPDSVQRFARTIVPKANEVVVKKEDLTLSTIRQLYIDVGPDAAAKATVLSDLYGALNIGQSIIFVNTKWKAFELAKQMREQGHSVSLICGTNKTGEEKVDLAYRDQVMSQFRTGVTKVLISTDVLARGIDVPAVTLVVNFEQPTWGRNGEANYETYVHRIGRTGRFGLKGVAVNLVTSSEAKLLDGIRKYYACTIDPLSADVEEMERILKGLR